MTLQMVTYRQRLLFTTLFLWHDVYIQKGREIVQGNSCVPPTHLSIVCAATYTLHLHCHSMLDTVVFSI